MTEQEIKSEREKAFDKLIEEQNDCEFRTTLCPNCNGDYCHIEDMTYFMPSNDDYVSPGRVHLGRHIKIFNENIDMGLRIREGQIDIHFSCEYCENEWIYRIAFHKGQTFEITKNIRNKK